MDINALPPGDSTLVDANIFIYHLGIHQVTRSDIIASHALRQAHGLFVNDSINLACAQRLTLTSVVTHDSDFNRVPNLSVWEPADI